MNIPLPQQKRKAVPEHVKSAIKHYAANSPDLTQKRIAELTGTSERSVYRVLQEAGLLTHLPRMTVEADKAMRTLKAWNIPAAGLQVFLEQLEDVGALSATTAETKVVNPRANRGAIIKHLVDMEEGTWAAFLQEIVTARVAKSHNVGVSTAMLNIQNAVDKNAKPGSN